MESKDNKGYHHEAQHSTAQHSTKLNLSPLLVVSLLLGLSFYSELAFSLPRRNVYQCYTINIENENGIVLDSFTGCTPQIRAIVSDINHYNGQYPSNLQYGSELVGLMSDALRDRLIRELDQMLENVSLRGPITLRTARTVETVIQPNSFPDQFSSYRCGESIMHDQAATAAIKNQLNTSILGLGLIFDVRFPAGGRRLYEISAPIGTVAVSGLGPCF